MAEYTNISWCTSSWSPWIGCTEVSDGCTNCYARALDNRHRYGGAKHWGPGVPRYRTKSWHQPIVWNKKAAASGERWTVFPSLCDPFDNEVPMIWRDELFALIALTPHLTWLLLTKRVGNARSYITDPETQRRVDTIKHVILAGRQTELHAAERTAEIARYPGYFVTSKGRILSDRLKTGERAVERHEIKPQPGEAGHARVMLQVNGERARELVHRLVLTAFDRAPVSDEQACHIDGKPDNNALWNLRWGDQPSNWEDSKRHGTRRRYAKLTLEDATMIREHHTAGETASAIARDFGISDTQVRNIARGVQWKPNEQLEWPLPSIWLGASVVNQEEADRDIPKLLATPAAKRFVSYEPALGPVDFSKWLPYNPVNEIDASRGNSLQSRPVRGIGNRHEGPGMAFVSAALEPMEEENRHDSMQAPPSGERHRGISTGARDGKRQESARAGSSAGMATLQGSDTGPTDRQPQGRQEEAERAAQSGTGNTLRANTSRGSRPRNGALRQSGRTKERDGEAHAPTGQSNSSSQGQKGGSVVDSGGLRDQVSNSVENRARRAMDNFWVICGGESSQGGAKARPFDLAWARQTVAQCKAAGVACFFKQAGSNPILDGKPLMLRDRSGADISEFPAGLQIQEFPA